MTHLDEGWDEIPFWGCIPFIQRAGHLKSFNEPTAFESMNTKITALTCHLNPSGLHLTHSSMHQTPIECDSMATLSQGVRCAFFWDG